MKGVIRRKKNVWCMMPSLVGNVVRNYSLYGSYVSTNGGNSNLRHGATNVNAIEATMADNENYYLLNFSPINNFMERRR